MNLREFVKVLDEKKWLIKIKKPVDTKYEISTIMRMLDGKPLLFDKVKGFAMPVVANICSTRSLVALGLGIKDSEIRIVLLIQIRVMVSGYINLQKIQSVHATFQIKLRSICMVFI